MPRPDILKARSLARKIWEKSGSQVPVDVMKIAKEYGIRIVTQPLEDTVSGMLVIKESRPIMGINHAHHPNRQRFTIAHEFGHFLLHGDATPIFVDAVYFRDSESTEGNNEYEIEANAFAAELLMPEIVIRELFAQHPVADIDDIVIRRLASRFEVSAQALTIRLATLRLLATEPT